MFLSLLCLGRVWSIREDKWVTAYYGCVFILPRGFIYQILNQMSWAFPEWPQWLGAGPTLAVQLLKREWLGLGRESELACHSLGSCWYASLPSVAVWQFWSNVPTCRPLTGSRTQPTQWPHWGIQVQPGRALVLTLLWFLKPKRNWNVKAIRFEEEKYVFKSVVISTLICQS